MTYSIIGILAAIILIIINRDVLWKQQMKKMTAIQRNYRMFLMGVLAYLITDMLWGILDSYHLITILYADTVVHFIAMAAAVMLWTRYVVSYLDEKTTFGKLLNYVGNCFVVFEIIIVTINLFHPIMFWFDESGTYQASIVRHINLAIQIMLFLLTAIYTLRVTAKAKGMKVLALTGKDGGKLAKVADVSVIVPEKETYKIQELHLPIYHTLCLMLEAHFYEN